MRTDHVMMMLKVRISLKISGQDFDVNKEFVELEHSVLKSQAEAKSGITRILTKSIYVKPLALSLMLMLLQQFSGIKVINSYIVQIFQNAGSKVKLFSTNHNSQH